MSGKKFKVVFLGDEGTGKTSIVQRYMYSRFESDVQATVGMDFASKTVMLDDGRSVKLQLWDTAGQERFRSLIPSYIRDASAAVVIYDITKPKSLESTRAWFASVREEREGEAVAMLVGNKSDLEEQREVSTDVAKELAAELGVMFLEVSAKANTNIPDLFKQVAGALPIPPKSEEEEEAPAEAPPAVQLVPRKSKKKDKCHC